jgi:pimeloyl-ACP methyl ester carboxylesterase
MTDLHVERLGAGPPVLLVHGSVSSGANAWRAQLPLAERWRLILPDRPGSGASGDVERVDFEPDAVLVAQLLGDGAHLVGHSYGGVVSLLAAARRPSAVRSLTVIEPPAFGVARGDPDVDRLVDSMEKLWADGPADPAGFLRSFYDLVQPGTPVPDPLPPGLARAARALMHERLPSEAEIPLRSLAAARIPTLVVSGGHAPAFETVCDRIADPLGAERAVLLGAGHAPQLLGPPFNQLLERFLHAV